ncbi:MAG TPA: flagellar biosynthesis protein FlgM [Anaeromyxobacteraceae bacterium]|nr:flagellar biosynthesis protein FlgM [Anaeromyxobacteraceae bacterium]
MKVRDASQIQAVQPTAQPDAVREARGRRERTDRVSTAQTEKVASAIADASRGAGASRAARLQVIEAAVRQGVYRPDPQRIAQQILNEAEIAAKVQALLK